MNHPVKYSLSIAARITIIYIVVGSLWIYYSDQFLLGVTKDSSILSMLQSYKGWLFILTSAAMLYLLVRGMTATVERAHRRTSQANQATLDGLLRAIELRDRDTEGHSQRVVHIALRLAQELDLPESKMQPLSQGALLHDIGKIGVPDSILRKPSKLTKAEWESMRQHPQRGYDLLRSVEHLKEAPSSRCTITSAGTAAATPTGCAARPSLWKPAFLPWPTCGTRLPRRGPTAGPGAKRRLSITSWKTRATCLTLLWWKPSPA